MRCHNFLKRGKTRVTKRRLAFVLRLIGWKDGAVSFDESQGAVEPKQTQIALNTSIQISLFKQHNYLKNLFVIHQDQSGKRITSSCVGLQDFSVYIFVRISETVTPPKSQEKFHRTYTVIQTDTTIPKLLFHLKKKKSEPQKIFSSLTKNFVKSAEVSTKPNGHYVLRAEWPVNRTFSAVKSFGLFNWLLVCSHTNFSHVMRTLVMEFYATVKRIRRKWNMNDQIACYTFETDAVICCNPSFA